jgi:hypothetical protein
LDEFSSIDASSTPSVEGKRYKAPRQKGAHACNPAPKPSWLFPFISSRTEDGKEQHQFQQMRYPVSLSLVADDTVISPGKYFTFDRSSPQMNAKRPVLSSIKDEVLAKNRQANAGGIVWQLGQQQDRIADSEDSNLDLKDHFFLQCSNTYMATHTTRRPPRMVNNTSQLVRKYSTSRTTRKRAHRCNLN